MGNKEVRNSPKPAKNAWLPYISKIPLWSKPPVTTGPKWLRTEKLLFNSAISLTFE